MFNMSNMCVSLSKYYQVHRHDIIINCNDVFYVLIKRRQLILRFQSGLCVGKKNGAITDMWFLKLYVSITPNYFGNKICDSRCAMLVLAHFSKRIDVPIVISKT